MAANLIKVDLDDPKLPVILEIVNRTRYAVEQALGLPLEQREQLLRYMATTIKVASDTAAAEVAAAKEP